MKTKELQTLDVKLLPFDARISLLYQEYPLVFVNELSSLPLPRGSQRILVPERLESSPSKPQDKNARRTETSTNPETGSKFFLVSPADIFELSEFVRESEKVKSSANTWLFRVAFMATIATHLLDNKQKLNTSRRGFFRFCSEIGFALLAGKETKEQVSPLQRAAEIKHQNEELLARIAYLQLYDASKRLLSPEQRKKQLVALSSGRSQSFRSVLNQTYERVTQDLIENEAFLAKLVYFYQFYGRVDQIFSYIVETFHLETGAISSHTKKFSDTEFLDKLEAAILAYLPIHPNNQNA